MKLDTDMATVVDALFHAQWTRESTTVHIIKHIRETRDIVMQNLQRNAANMSETHLRAQVEKANTLTRVLALIENNTPLHT